MSSQHQKNTNFSDFRVCWNQILIQVLATVALVRIFRTLLLMHFITSWSLSCDPCIEVFLQICCSRTLIQNSCPWATEWPSRKAFALLSGDHELPTMPQASVARSQGSEISRALLLDGMAYSLRCQSQQHQSVSSCIALFSKCSTPPCDVAWAAVG